jgi:Alpha/beta hydrolase domain
MVISKAAQIKTRFGFGSTADEVLSGIDLAGKRIVVTGGSSGIGIETVRALARTQAEVTLAVRRIATRRRDLGAACRILVCGGNQRAFPTLVPQVDTDGNELAGVRIPELTVPLATYTGWNLRNPAIGAPDRRVAFIGSYLPFALTVADRQKFDDPRLSINERYINEDDYLARYRRAAVQLIKDRWLLQEDLPAVMDRAKLEWQAAQLLGKS